MTQTKIKYHNFDKGDTLEYRGSLFKVVDTGPGVYYTLQMKMDAGLREMNSSYVEMNFTKVKTFEDEMEEL